jgi:hypothetical protein
MDTNLFYYNNIAHYGPYEKYLDNPHTDIYKIALDDQDFWDYIGDIESNGNGSIFIQQVMMGQHSCVHSLQTH